MKELREGLTFIKEDTMAMEGERGMLSLRSPRRKRVIRGRNMLSESKSMEAALL